MSTRNDTVGTLFFSGPRNRGISTRSITAHNTAARIVSTHRLTTANRIIAATPAADRYGDAAAAISTTSLLIDRYRATKPTAATASASTPMTVANTRIMLCWWRLRTSAQPSRRSRGSKSFWNSSRKRR